MKINNILLPLNISPWPIMLMINLFLLFFKIINLLNFSFKMNIYLNMLILFLINYYWMNNSLMEKYLSGMKNLFLNISMKFFIINIIMSELMFFLTFFYNYYSMNYFLNSMFNFKININILKLNYILALLNLMILLTSSISLTLFTFLNFNNKNNKIYYLINTFLLALYFILIQMFEYLNMNFNSTNSIFYSNFFLLTIFHMSHVIMGMILMMMFMIKIFKLNFNLKIKIKMTCWYWHFVDLIWIMIFFIIY